MVGNESCLKIKHLLRYPIQKYPDSPNAYSRDIVGPHRFTLTKKGDPPIRWNKRNEEHRGYIFYRFGNYMLFTQVYPIHPSKDGKGYHKVGVGCHTAIIPENYLRRKRLTLPAIKDAMENFRVENRDVLMGKECEKGCEIKDLNIIEGGQKSDEFLSRYISKQALKKMIKEYKVNNKIMLLSRRDLSSGARFKLGVLLVELIDFDMGITEINFFTSPPKQKYANMLTEKFNLAMVSKKFRTVSGSTTRWWALKDTYSSEVILDLNEKERKIMDKALGRVKFKVINPVVKVSEPKLMVKTSRDVSEVKLHVNYIKLKGEQNEYERNLWVIDLEKLTHASLGKFKAELWSGQNVQDIEFKIVRKKQAKPSIDNGKGKKTRKEERKKDKINIPYQEKGSLSEVNQNGDQLNDVSSPSEDINKVNTDLLKPTHDIKELAKQQKDD